MYDLNYRGETYYLASSHTRDLTPHTTVLFMLTVQEIFSSLYSFNVKGMPHHVLLYAKWQRIACCTDGMHKSYASDHIVK